MTNRPIEQLSTLIAKARRVLLAVHEHPDGDALGAMLGLADYLRDQGKEVTTMTPDAAPEYFSYLPGSDRIVHALPKPLAGYELVVLLDCGDVKRTHIPFSERRVGQPPVVNIDHHPTTTTLDGTEVVDVNMVDTGASSTSEIIYDMLLDFEATITKGIATCLLTGICTDTGNFQNLGTTQTCLVAASKLLIYGANLTKIIEATNKNKSVGALKLWGRALSRLKKDEATGLVSTVIRQRDIDECGVDVSAAEGVANFLNSLGEARATLVLKEEPNGAIRGSYRTTKEGVDVSAMAKRYGGGGHVKAAGFTVQGRLVETATGWTIETA